MQYGLYHCFAYSAVLYIQRRKYHRQTTTNKYLTLQMELLKAKQEEDRKRLEEQFKADMEAQREQMQNMMTANMEELRKDREAIVEQNQTLKETIESMHQSMEQRNAQITELQKQIIAIALRPPPPPPSGGGGCIIL